MADVAENGPFSGLMAKRQRNYNLWRYHLNHPNMTHEDLARVFKISRGRVTQIIREYEKARGRLADKSEGGNSKESPHR